MRDIQPYINSALELLQKMIAIPSLSFEEEKRCDMLCGYLQEKGVEIERIGNNIIAQIKGATGSPTLLLNSHIDTVPANAGYTFDPYNPPQNGEIIYGLGSNDDGASVVSMIATFLYYLDNPQEKSIGICLALSCEEERSGANGLTAIADYLATIADYAIVGEPTSLKVAIAERGLLVIDAYSEGKSVHVAHSHLGKNAISKAIKDIATLEAYKFEKVSDLMGETRLNVTQIESGTAHNIIPDKCHYVVDIRPTDVYTNSEIVDILSNIVESDLVPRNLKNRTSSIPQDHILVQTAKEMGRELIISQTTSDWMRMKIPAIKVGPGDTNRSHKADEFVYKTEISEAIEFYINFINRLK